MYKLFLHVILPLYHIFYDVGVANHITADKYSLQIILLNDIEIVTYYVIDVITLIPRCWPHHPPSLLNA